MAVNVVSLQKDAEPFDPLADEVVPEIDNLGRRTDGMEDFENYTVATLHDKRYKNFSFKIKRKEAVFICWQHC